MLLLFFNYLSWTDGCLQDLEVIDHPIQGGVNVFLILVCLDTGL